MSKAYRETTPSQERICINGLWQWQPAGAKINAPPTENWGYLRVPGPWPGAGQGGQRRSGGQVVYPNPAWRGGGAGDGTMAWFQREIEVPKAWAGRHIAVTADYLNSRAIVFVDGQRLGEMLYPAGEVDITSACRSAGKHLLSLGVSALPLSEVVAVFSDSNAPKQGAGRWPAAASAATCIW